MITSLRNRKKLMILAAAVIVAVAASAVVLNLTKPYAVYAEVLKLKIRMLLKQEMTNCFL